MRACAPTSGEINLRHNISPRLPFHPSFQQTTVHLKLTACGAALAAVKPDMSGLQQKHRHVDMQRRNKQTSGKLQLEPGISTFSHLEQASCFFPYKTVNVKRCMWGGTCHRTWVFAGFTYFFSRPLNRVYSRALQQAKASRLPLLSRLRNRSDRIEHAFACESNGLDCFQTSLRCVFPVCNWVCFTYIEATFRSCNKAV